MNTRLANLLPKTSSIQLRIVIVLLASPFLVLAIWSIAVGLIQVSEGNIASAATVLWGGVLLFCGIGLWRLRSWARKLAKVCIAIVVVVGILGVFNPFFAMDYSAEHGGAQPDWKLLVAIVAPLVALGLYCFWVLDKYEAEFGTPAE